MSVDNIQPNIEAPNAEPQTPAQPEPNAPAPAEQNSEPSKPEGATPPPVDFGQLTGGRYKTWADAEAEIESLRTFKEQASQNPRESAPEVEMNPVLKAANDMYLKGASDDEVQNFLRLQRLDVTNLNDNRAIMEHLKLQYPSLGESDILAEFDDRYGADPEDEAATNRAQRKIKIDAIAAKKAIQEQVLQASEPQSVRSKKEAEMQRQQLEGTWQQQLGAVKEIPFKVEHKVGEFEYSYELPVGVTEEVRAKLAAYSAQDGIQPSPQAMQNIQKAALTMAISNDPVAFAKAIAADSIAKAMEWSSRRSENNDPVDRPVPSSPDAPLSPQQARNKLLERSRGH